MLDDHAIETGRTAHHEAGHAVAADVYDLNHTKTTMQVRRVGWLWPRLIGTGVSSYDDTGAAETAAHLRGRVIACLAGPLAEARWNQLNQRMKRADAERLARANAPTDVASLRTLRRDAKISKAKAYRITRTWVRKNWAAIESVAAVLAVTGTADAAVVTRLRKRARARR